MTRFRAEWERADQRFDGVHGDAFVEVLYDDGRWLEGPAYSPLWRSVLFSDIPNDRVLRWDETTGAVGVWRTPASYANGRTLDRAGRVLTCEQQSRSVTRTGSDGGVTTVADRWEGHRFNSPNDLVEHSDGSVWFTDPSYGIRDVYEGFPAVSETDGCHVYRIDRDGSIARVADDFAQPNGLAFSADERQLYVVDSDATRRHLRRFDVGADGTLSGGEVLVGCDAGTYDGVRVDDSGRLWLAARDGLHCVDPDGTLLGKLLLPEVCSNLTFGGARGNVLFVTATHLLLSIMVGCSGARYP
ncbi:MAG: SMP-30/gluconolactonase/LRE family protein [Actinomycetota bacterium]|nr:SMP-30/gluconolactonase/LRE family protein [Actinomycetota bacterium]